MEILSVSEVSSYQNDLCFLSPDRGFSYRISLYNKLTELGFHVLAFDYRSYGDSSPVRLSETTTVEDGLAVFT